MVDEVLLYISAASDVETEREVLAKLTTEIPVTLGWKIVQSPLRGQPIDRPSILNADIHLLILGSDIRAPIGVEWTIARNAGRMPLLFRKSSALHTPAAEDFLRVLQNVTTWNHYKDTQDLRIQVLKYLTDNILEKAIHYALRPEEYHGLLEWRKELDVDQGQEEEKAHGGIGESGIIFSRERYIPSGGVLLEFPKIPQSAAGKEEKQ